MKTVLLCLLLAVTFPVLAQNFKIGHRQVAYTDNSRSNRSIPVEVYYPANTGGENVPVANVNKKYPLIVFGHGYQLTYSDYLWLKDSLVPKGFFVAFPRTEEKLFPSHNDFAQDLAFIVDAFKSNNTNASSWCYKRLLDKYFVSGHSMGGGCSLLSVQYSSNITGIFNFAAAETNPSAIAASSSIVIPALMFAGGKDCVCPPPDNQLPMYKNIQPECKTYVRIIKAKHCHWANNSGGCTFGELTCGNVSSPASSTLQTTISLLLPWLRLVTYNSDADRQQFQNMLTTLTTITYLQACKDEDKNKNFADDKLISLKVYPSIVHAGTTVNIQLPAATGFGTLKVINQQDNTVSVQNIASVKSVININTSAFERGIYFISVEAGAKMFKGRFIVE